MRKNNFFVILNSKKVSVGIVSAPDYEEACERLAGEYIPSERDGEDNEISFSLRSLETHPGWREMSGLDPVLALNKLGHHSGRVFTFYLLDELIVVFPPEEPLQKFIIKKTASI